MSLLVLPKSVLASTFICLILWLTGLDLLIEKSHPLRYLSLGGYISKDQEPLADKLTQLKRKKDSINTLLLGSSLPMCAAACSDARLEQRPSPRVDYDLFCYSDAHYLEAEIEKVTTKRPVIFNFTGNGCMLSDAYKLWQECKKLGVKPSQIILAVAPRDFLDNLACKYGETAYYRFFNKSPETQPLLSILDNNWHFFEVRRDYKTLLTLLSTDIFKRAPDLYTATETPNNLPIKVSTFSTEGIEADSTGNQKKKAKDLITYRASYLPINRPRYRKELAIFQRFLADCQKENIDCLVVSMPLTIDNLSIMPNDFVSQYLKEIKEAARLHGCKFLNLTCSSEFAESDFRDSVHPNGDGGVKICRKIAKCLASANLAITKPNEAVK